MSEIYTARLADQMAISCSSAMRQADGTGQTSVGMN